MTLLNRVVVAVVVAVGVGLFCIFIGLVLATLQAPIAVTVGSFLKAWGWVIGVLAGLYQFAGGRYTVG